MTDCPGQVNTITSSDALQWVWYIISNFYESKSFTGVEYGIQYDPTLYLYAAAGLCTPSPALTIEYPATGSWPDAGSAIAITLTGTPIWNGTMLTSGYIRGYHYVGSDPTTITLMPSPQTSGMGWLLEDGRKYWPECVGVLGIDMDGQACCSVAPPEPQACCLPDGRCIVVLADDCTAQGGVVYPDPTCDGVVCPQPPHACCFPDGHCEDLLAVDCQAAGGVVYPELCATTVCPQPPEPQACCFPDGSCVDLLAPDCEARVVWCIR